MIFNNYSEWKIIKFVFKWASVLAILDLGWLMKLFCINFNTITLQSSSFVTKRSQLHSEVSKMGGGCCSRGDQNYIYNKKYPLCFDIKTKLVCMSHLTKSTIVDIRKYKRKIYRKWNDG